MKHFALLFGVVFFAHHSHAYLISDHDKLMTIAYHQFTQCLNQTEDSAALNQLSTGDVNEDLNLVRKWVSFSHFYNPEIPVTAYIIGNPRKPSNERVALIESELLNLATLHTPEAKEEFLYQLGHAIHHIQDMTAPPHVVPVNHPLPINGFQDGFESYPYRDSILENLAKNPPLCSFVGTEPDSPSKILFKTAKATLYTLRTEKLRTKCDGEEHRISWSAFWQEYEKSDDGFGRYGMYGNHFGDAVFENPNKPGQEIRMNPADYRRLMQQQMEAAIARSVEALYWGYLQLN